jgi:hypothetical protein
MACNERIVESLGGYRVTGHCVMGMVGAHPPASDPLQRNDRTPRVPMVGLCFKPQPPSGHRTKQPHEGHLESVG